MRACQHFGISRNYSISLDLQRLSTDVNGSWKETAPEAVFGAHWPAEENRRGFLRGTPRRVIDMVEAYRDAGVERLNIALREGPYDWDALQAFADQVLPAFGIRRAS